MSERDLNGVLVVDKPGLDKPGETAGEAGERPYLLTSHDVVQRVRRWSRQRRIGHTGTLDPMATGVLVLCLGAATRLVEYYQGHDKCYTAAVTLGVTTDTYDAVGEVTARCPVGPLEPARIEEVLARFRGAIEQRPPIYSALKQGGESLHRKARRGEEVTVEARPVTIHRLDLLSIEAPDRLWLRVECSAGGYVRSLAYDIGAALGVGGHLSYLRRDAAGHFAVAAAHSLDAVERAAQEGALSSLLLPPGVGLDLPRLPVDDEVARRLGQGQKVWVPSGPDVAAGEIAQAVDTTGSLLGIVRLLERSTGEERAVLCKADKWLASQSDL